MTCIETVGIRMAKAFVVYWSHLMERLYMVPLQNFLRAVLLTCLKIGTALVKFGAVGHEAIEDGGQCRG